MDKTYDKFLKSRNFERIKSDFESSARWETCAGMHWTQFENMKWLILEVERLNEAVETLKSAAEINLDEYKKIAKQNIKLEHQVTWLKNKLDEYREAERKLKCPGCGMRTVIYNNMNIEREICGTCDDWNELINRETGWCRQKLIAESEKTVTTADFSCDMDHWKPKEKETCGTCKTCTHWVPFFNDYNYGNCKKKIERQDRVITTCEDRKCDMQSWWPKEKKAELPEHASISFPGTVPLALVNTINKIIDYLKANEKE